MLIHGPDASLAIIDAHLPTVPNEHHQWLTTHRAWSLVGLGQAEQAGELLADQELLRAVAANEHVDESDSLHWPDLVTGLLTSTLDRLGRHEESQRLAHNGLAWQRIARNRIEVFEADLNSPDERAAYRARNGSCLYSWSCWGQWRARSRCRTNNLPP